MPYGLMTNGIVCCYPECVFGANIKLKAHNWAERWHWLCIVLIESFAQLAPDTVCFVPIFKLDFSRKSEIDAPLCTEYLWWCEQV